MRKPQEEQIGSPDTDLTDPEARNSGMLRRLRHFAWDKSGSYMVVGALAMPVLIGAAGLGTEVGFWMHQQQKMQDAADSAAFAAATYYGSNPTATLDNSAGSVAAGYGFTGGITAGSSQIVVSEPPADGPSKGSVGSVEVTIRRTYPRMLSAIFNQTPVAIWARAVAKTHGGYGCVLALDPTASASAAIQGTPNVSLNNCSLYDNSNSPGAVSGGGSASLTAASVGVVGGITGGSHFTTTEGIWTGQPPTPDPYADVNVPAFSGCDYNNYTPKKHDTLNPGVYCGGISFNGNVNATLNDGTYIFDGGSFSVNGGATITGNHVTLVFTSSSGNNYPSVTINGGATISLGPPSTGSLAGIVIYADRKTPLGTSFKFNGGSGQVLGGAVYVPTGAINYSGGSNVSTVCTQIIGDTVTFSGNAYLAVNCTGVGVGMWGTGARLSE